MAAKSLTQIHLGLVPIAAALNNDQLLLATAKANHERTSAVGYAGNAPGKPNPFYWRWKSLSDEIERREKERELIREFDRPRYEKEVVMQNWRKPRPMFV